jgi:hypothetical protein
MTTILTKEIIRNQLDIQTMVNEEKSCSRMKWHENTVLNNTCSSILYQRKGTQFLWTPEGNFAE